MSHGFSLISISPSEDTNCFSSWWSKAVRAVDKESNKRLNSLIILVAWEIWKHRNHCVFNGVNPSVVCGFWCMAGASKFSEFLSRSLTLVV